MKTKKNIIQHNVRKSPGIESATVGFDSDHILNAFLPRVLRKPSFTRTWDHPGVFWWNNATVKHRRVAVPRVYKDEEGFSLMRIDDYRKD